MTGQRVSRLAVLLSLAAAFAGGLWWRLPDVAAGRADPISAQGRAIELAMRDGRLQEALPQVRAWAQAYPADPFPRYLEATIDQRLERWSDAADAWQAYLGLTGTPGVACPVFERSLGQAWAERPVPADLRAVEQFVIRQHVDETAKTFALPNLE